LGSRIGATFFSWIAAATFGLSQAYAVRPADGGVLFEAESFSIGESGSSRCIQVGLFVRYTGMEPRSWKVLTAVLNYSAAEDMFTGSPAVIFSDFGSESPGLSLPPSSHGLPCKDGDTLNSVVLKQSMDVPLAGGFGSKMHLSQVNPLTGRIELAAASDGRLFTTGPGERQLFAVVVFPLAGDSEGEVRLEFVPDSLILDGNLLLDDSGARFRAYTLDGEVRVQSSWSAPSLSDWGLALFFTGLLSSTLLIRRRRRRG